MPWCPSSTTSGPESVTVVGRVTGSIAPLRRRAMYQGSRSIPCDECPHSSAVTRLSASSRASDAGTPTASRMRHRARQVLGGNRVRGHRNSFALYVSVYSGVSDSKS